MRPIRRTYTFNLARNAVFSEIKAQCRYSLYFRVRLNFFNQRNFFSISPQFFQPFVVKMSPQTNFTGFVDFKTRDLRFIAHYLGIAAIKSAELL